MNCSFFSPVRAVILGTALMGLSATAPNATPVQSGVLECNVAPGVGVIIGSSKSLSCVFHRAHGAPEFYAGTISRIGLDIGVTGPGHFVWGVFTEAPGPHYALTGNYAGPGVGLALGAGGTADTLVGGYANSISLQPLSGPSTGLNLSAGIGTLTLQPVLVGPSRRHRHG